LIPKEEAMFTGRDELVRYEQNKDAVRQAEAHRLAKQLQKSDGNSAFIPGMFAWLRSRIFRFTPTLDAENHLLEIEHAASQLDESPAKLEPIAAQE